MSNPTVTIGDTIFEPADPNLTRKSFTRIVYSDLKFDTYAKGEYDGSFGTFEPDGKGQRFWMWVPFDDAEGNPVSTPFPDLVTPDAWEIIKTSASGFRTSHNSIMPAKIIPSTKLVDNGYHSDGIKAMAYTPIGQKTIEAFNWELDDAQGVTVGPTETD